MKIVLEDPGNEEDTVIIRCRQITDEVLRALAVLKGDGDKIVAYQGEEIYTLAPSEICYFESVDNRVFVYGQKTVFESRQKLYELEEQLAHTSFLRISKSVILNIKSIAFLSPAFNGRMEASLHNGEKIIITRSYVNDMKKKLGL